MGEKEECVLGLVLVGNCIIFLDVLMTHWFGRLIGSPAGNEFGMG